MPPAVGTAEVLCVEMTPETTFGTPQGTAPDKRWDFTATRPNINTTSVDDSERKTGVYTVGSNKLTTKQWVEWPLEFDGRLDTLAALLKMALGSLTTGAQVGGLYPHTIVESNANNDSHTWFWKDAQTGAGKLEQVSGMKVARITGTLVAGGKMALKADLIGKGAESGTGTTEATATAPSKNTDQMLVYANLSAFSIGGTDLKAKLKEFEFVIEVMYDQDASFSAGSIYMVHLVKTGVRLTGRLVLEHDTNSTISDVTSKTGKAMKVTLTQGTSSAVLDWYKAVFEDTSVDSGKNNVSRKPLTFDGLYSDSDGKPFQAVITNAVAAYT